MSRDIIMLGAGASKADGAPMQNEILKEYIHLFQRDQIPVRISKNINPFLRDFFGVLVDNPKINPRDLPTFEEMLGVLEIADARNEYFRHHIKSKARLNLIKRNLIYLIAIVLDKKLSSHYGEFYHYKLVRRLERENSLRDTTFISLNYDVILDNILSKVLGWQIDYGCDFFHRGGYTEGNSIKLYKLHGSLNWIYCPYCNTLLHGTPRDVKIAARNIYDQNVRCDNCNSKKLEPLIIPPTYFKAMSNLYIQQIWHKTDIVLRQARRIFICGYSLPEADIHIKYLLKRAEIYESDRELEIYIVNGVKSLEEESQEKERFQRFFKHKIEVRYTRLSFEDFSKFGI